ncbi:unnamed protein product [Urochloa decumbens]|uniref:Uncharacterized protein n=1 Tax=Urochloa decumbens TaxID=240449 RepID=A0ABC8XRN6_9POAL
MEGMEKALTKLGSFTISRKAKKELSAIGGDISRLSSTVEEKAKWVFEKLKGHKKSLPDLLREHNLPPGLFPRNIICYKYDELNSKLVVHLSKPCELSGIEGMKTKVVVWVKVASVSLESYKSDKVCFIAGVKKLRQKDAYEVPREAVSVEEF